MDAAVMASAVDEVPFVADDPEAAAAASTSQDTPGPLWSKDGDPTYDHTGGTGQSSYRGIVSQTFHACAAWCFSSRTWTLDDIVYADGNWTTGGQQNPACNGPGCSSL